MRRKEDGRSMVVQPPVVLLQRLGSLAHSRPAGHFFKTLRSSLGLSFSAVVKLSGHLRVMSALGSVADVAPPDHEMDRRPQRGFLLNLTMLPFRVRSRAEALIGGTGHG
jgi:hypothetical protein